MHPITFLAFVVLAAVALVAITNRGPAPDASTVAAQAAQDPVTVAVPRHDPDRGGAVQPPPTMAVALPHQDPPALRPASGFALETVTVQAEPEPAALPEPKSAEPKPVEQESAEAKSAEAKSTAPAFVEADATLYAKESARLRAAPSTSADILVKLDADAALRATARSTDGTWWRVSLADGREGYVHRIAVNKNRVVAANPAATPKPVVAEARLDAASKDRDGLLDYVDETVDWFTDTASRGRAPTIIRTER